MVIIDVDGVSRPQRCRYCTAVANFRELIIPVVWYIRDDLKCDETHMKVKISGHVIPPSIPAICCFVVDGGS